MSSISFLFEGMTMTRDPYLKWIESKNGFSLMMDRRRIRLSGMDENF